MYSAAVVTNSNSYDMDYLKYFNTMQELVDVQIYLNAYTALTEITKNQFELIIVDLDIADSQVLELAARFLKHNPKLLLVLIVDNYEYALEAMQMGILDYIVRPVSSERLGVLIEKLKRKRG